MGRVHFIGGSPDANFAALHLHRLFEVLDRIGYLHEPRRT